MNTVDFEFKPLDGLRYAIRNAIGSIMYVAAMQGINIEDDDMLVLVPKKHGSLAYAALNVVNGRIEYAETTLIFVEDEYADTVYVLTRQVTETRPRVMKDSEGKPILSNGHYIPILDEEGKPIFEKFKRPVINIDCLPMRVVVQNTPKSDWIWMPAFSARTEISATVQFRVNMGIPHLHAKIINVFKEGQ